MAVAARRRRSGRSPVTVGLIALAIVLIAVFLGFTKDIPFTHGFRLNAVFESSNGLRVNSPVRIAGVQVGKVKAIKPKEGTDQALVVMEINKNGLPLHEDATAKIRPRIFLEGNFFVDLTAGSAGSPELGNGDTLKVTRTAAPVQLDQVLTSLQSDTRQDLRDLLDALGTGLNSKPTAAEDKAADPSTRGETAAQAWNDSYKYGPTALRGASQVNEGLLGTEPSRDVARLLAGTAKTTGALIRNEGLLKDLITNFNTTMGAFASEQDNLSTSIGLLPGTLENANATLASLNRAFPPTRAFAREILPGVNESAATIDASFPWVRETRKLLSQAELRGLAEDLAPTTKSLAQLTDASLKLLPEINDTSRCARDVVLPTGDIVVQDSFANGERQLQGVLAGDGRARRREPELRRQRLLRALPGRRRHQHGRARLAGLGDRQARRVGARARARRAAEVPGQAPAVQLERSLLQEQDPERQRAGGRRWAGRGDAVRTAIRKHWLDFVAIIGLIVIAGAVAVFILGKQRLTLPAWVPLVGKDFFVLKADMSTAQAVTPGQGQTVNIAGVEVGEISNVELKDGKAVITMKMQPKYSRVYRDATVLLRPKTGLKDMVAELEPGTRRRGPAARGRRDPGEPDAAGRQPRRDPRVGGRRHARLPDDPAQRRRRGPARRRARAGARDPALRADRALREQGVRRARDAQAQHQARRPQPVAADGRARRPRRPGGRVRRELERRVLHPRGPGRQPARVAEQAADRAPGDAERARQGARAGRRARPDAAGAAAGRAGARADPAQRAPVRARDHPGHP